MRARGCRQPGVATQSGHGTVPHHTHTHQAKYDRKMKLLRDDLELRRKHELHEVEERKNGHINELMRQHEAAFSEVKNYYNDITANNLDLIKASCVVLCCVVLWLEAGRLLVRQGLHTSPAPVGDIFCTERLHAPPPPTQALKEDVAEMKKREAQNEKLMWAAGGEGRRAACGPAARLLCLAFARRSHYACRDTHTNTHTHTHTHTR